MDSKMTPCGVPWCVALAPAGAQFCQVYGDARSGAPRSKMPPPVQPELEKLFLKAMNLPAVPALYALVNEDGDVVCSTCGADVVAQ